MSQIGGRFYDQVDTGVVVDIRAMPSHELQTSLAKEMEKYDELEQLDIRYRDLMCGASVSNVEAVWVVRNSSQTMMTDKDLQRFESKAWSDYVGKRFTQAGSTNGLGKTMFDIVRSLKLQMRHFVVHGFHPKVEAAETRVVQYLQGKEFLPISSWGLRETCIRLRRSEEFYAPFAIAVGTQLLCCNGNANGLNATRYNKDIQHAYRDVDVSALVKTLHEARSTLVKTLNQVDATDYVTRLSGLRFVVPQVDVPEAEPTIRGGSSITVSAGGGAGAAMPTVDLTPFQRELAAINAKIDNLGDLAPPSFDLNPVMELITSYQRRNEAQINTLYDILAAQMGIRAGPSPMMAAGGRGRGGGGAGGGGGGAGGGGGGDGARAAAGGAGRGGGDARDGARAAVGGRGDGAGGAGGAARVGLDAGRGRGVRFADGIIPAAGPAPGAGIVRPVSPPAPAAPAAAVGVGGPAAAVGVGGPAAAVGVGGPAAAAGVGGPAAAVGVGAAAGGGVGLARVGLAPVATTRPTLPNQMAGQFYLEGDGGSAGPNPYPNDNQTSWGWPNNIARGGTILGPHGGATADHKPPPEKPVDPTLLPADTDRAMRQLQQEALY